jgi:molybdenum cofactor cytidylyltransferase
MNDRMVHRIGAVVLAAGLSTRMGRPKMIMPWNGTTVVRKVVTMLIAAQAAPIVVVTGGAHEEVEKAVNGLPVQTVFNPQYPNGEMLDSLQLGLQNMPSDVHASLIVLGDQPQLEVDVVKGVISLYRAGEMDLVVPSYQMRRGHPWLVSRSLWTQILELAPPQTLRDFIRANQERIHYLTVNTPSILQDLDTPEDYNRQQPGSRQ